MRQKWPQKPPLGTPINWSHPSTKGLVLDLEFQEGGGDLANDLSGNENHGTINNMAFPPTAVSGWNAGRKGTALSFDGTDDYVDIADVFDIVPYTKPRTISVGIKSDIDQDHKVIMSKSDIDSPWYGWILEVYNGGDNQWRYQEYNEATNCLGGIWTNASLRDGNWHQIVVSRGDQTVANLKIYVDGIEQSFDSVYDTLHADIDVPEHLQIGARDGANWLFNGQIDQVRVYNRALGAEEIIDSYLNPFGRFERTKWGLLVPSSVSGLSIPVAMHNYRRLRV